MQLAYYVAPISSGLGDLVVSLPAIQALIKTGKPTYLISRTPMQEGLENRIPGLAGQIRETEFDVNKLSSEDTYFNMRNHPLQTDYIWGSKEFEEQYPGYKITEVMKGICQDFGIAANFETLEPLPFALRKDVAGAIILVVGSAGIVKCWPSNYWIQLSEELKAKGYRVLMVGQPERSPIVRECIRAGLSLLETPTMSDALDVLSSARCVVAGDTGLMHLAVQQNIPTVALFRYNIMFMREYPHVTSIVAPICHQECINIEYSAVPNKVVTFHSFEENKDKLYWETWSCTREDWKERCMAAIKPSSVLAALNNFLSVSVL